MASITMRNYDGAPTFTITAANQQILASVVGEIKEAFAGSCNRIDMKRVGQVLFAVATWMVWIVGFLLLFGILLVMTMALALFLWFLGTLAVNAVREAWARRSVRVKGNEDVELSGEGQVVWVMETRRRRRRMWGSRDERRGGSGVSVWITLR